MSNGSVENEIDIYAWTKTWALDEGLKLWAEVEAGSTNTVAKDDTSPITQPALSPAETVSEPSLYITKNQTQGRGRGDHVWTMPPGSSLLSSWSFGLSKIPQPIFSPLAGLALFESVKEIWPEIEFNLKAPNDLFIGEKKTAGLLIETIDRGSARHTVIGLGLNVTASPPSVTTATNLAEHWLTPVTQDSWTRFLSTFARNLKTALKSGQSDFLSEDVRERLKHALNLHPLLREPILDVDESGQLRSKSRMIYWHEL